MLTPLKYFVYYVFHILLAIFITYQIHKKKYLYTLAANADFNDRDERYNSGGQGICPLFKSISMFLSLSLRYETEASRIFLKLVKFIARNVPAVN